MNLIKITDLTSRLNISSRSLRYYEQAGLIRPVEASILHLPPMRALSSRLGEDPDASDPEGFWHWAQTRGLAPGEPGRHEQFEYQTASGDVAVLRIPDGFENSGPYADYAFGGGLFAAANVFLDEDVGERFRALV